MDQAPRPWSELEEKSRFDLVIDGFKYVIREPSVLQLLAKGFVPQALVVGSAGGVSRPGEVKLSFLSDEVMQDQMILAHVIEPHLVPDAEAGALSGDVPLSWIGKHRDEIVNAILSRLFDTEITRGAAFRGKEGVRAPAGPGRKGKRTDPDGAASAA